MNKLFMNKKFGVVRDVLGGYVQAVFAHAHDRTFADVCPLSEPEPFPVVAE